MAVLLSPLPPPPRGLFQSMTFSDVWQTAAFVITSAVLVTRMQASQEHESEMRRALESRTVELIASISTRQTENSARFDQRFSENATRDHEALAKLETGLARQGDKLDALGSKLDTLAASFAIAQQQQQQQQDRRITR